MSREFEMLVRITGFESSRQKNIEKACCSEWPFEAENFSTETGANDTRILTTRAMDSLYAGESEEEFTDRLAMAIWKANHGYCEVEVQALYLEELPYEQHVREEDNYQRLMKKAANGGE